ncbi:MAG TPA: PPC domain-containing protein, partial [Planctomycetaceae bacterium]|nr:PPC domain-containing protein [Planctomycetaceae bacterium]
MLSFCLLISAAQAEAPSLTHIFPPGGQRGTTVPVKLNGKFAWPVSIDAPSVEIKPGTESGALEITIPADLAADRVWIRAFNAEGASATVPLLIGNLKELNETEPNNKPREAQTLAESRVIINGVLKGADVDGFSVPLEPGQTLIASLEANGKLGSPMDAILQVCAADGTVLAENHDDPGLDPRIVFPVKKPGHHIVRVFGYSSTPNTSIAFQGGDTSLYRLTITTGPLVTRALPLSASVTEPASAELLGWGLPPQLRLPVQPWGIKEEPEFEASGEMRTPSMSRLAIVSTPELAGSARVRLVPWPSILATANAEPQPVPLPSSVTGCLRQPKQTDLYRLTLKKGDPLLVTVESRGLDLPLDPLVKLVSPSGKTAAEVDDTGNNRDAVLSHKAAEDGDYILHITDRHRFGSDRGYYLLTARLEESDFELTAAAESFVVQSDKPAEIVVNVVRRTGIEGAVGPITIEAVDLPPGVTAMPVVSEVKGDT